MRHRVIHRRWGPLGFTLSEAAMAVGITAIAVMSMVGLLPSSLDSIHQSASMTADARIVQGIKADCEMRDWTVLRSQQTAKTVEDRYFDYHGMEVSKATADASFRARVEVADAPVLPGSSSTNTRMRTIIIKVITGSDDALFGKPKFVRTYRTVVAQTDQTP